MKDAEDIIRSTDRFDITLVKFFFYQNLWFIPSSFLSYAKACVEALIKYLIFALLELYFITHTLFSVIHQTMKRENERMTQNRL